MVRSRCGLRAKADGADLLAVMSSCATRTQREQKSRVPRHDLTIAPRRSALRRRLLERPAIWERRRWRWSSWRRFHRRRKQRRRRHGGRDQRWLDRRRFDRGRNDWRRLDRGRNEWWRLGWRWLRGRRERVHSGLWPGPNLLQRNVRQHRERSSSLWPLRRAVLRHDTVLRGHLPTSAVLHRRRQLSRWANVLRRRLLWRGPALLRCPRAARWNPGLPHPHHRRAHLPARLCTALRE